LVIMFWSDDPVRDWDEYQEEIERSASLQESEDGWDDEYERRREMEEDC